jgi:hypothetical protein
LRPVGGFLLKGFEDQDFEIDGEIWPLQARGWRCMVQVEREDADR